MYLGTMDDRQLYTEVLGINPEVLHFGVNASWEVVDVKMNPVNGVNLATEEVVISIQYTKSVAPCAECGEEHCIYDTRDSRRWRHLDTCQLKTYLVCKVPRVQCPVHGVKTIRMPWAEQSSRFTMLFERFAIELLLVSKNQTKTAIRMWRTANQFRQHSSHHAKCCGARADST